MHKGLSLGVVLGFSAFSFADRIVNVPVARTIGYRAVRYESLYGVNEIGTREQFLAVSPIRFVEIEFRNRQRLGENGRLTFDVSRNLTPAISGTAPGLSVGILDALNETLDGRRGYIALTFKELLEVSDTGEPGEVTIGFQSGSKDSAFLGISLPLSARTRFLTEHNGFRLTAGLESEVLKGFRARTFVQDRTLLMGLSYSIKF